MESKHHSWTELCRVITGISSARTCPKVLYLTKRLELAQITVPEPDATVNDCRAFGDRRHLHRRGGSTAGQQEMRLVYASSLSRLSRRYVNQQTKEVGRGLCRESASMNCQSVDDSQE
eukprot:4032226-Amphidinium_carterae.1